MSREAKCYVAKVGFTIGDTEQKIEAGTRIVFDGYRAEIEGEPAVVLPRLKTVIKAGWLAPEGGSEPSYHPQSADMQVSAATPNKKDSKFQTVVSAVDEQIVGSFRNRQALHDRAKEQATGRDPVGIEVDEEMGEIAQVRTIGKRNVGREGEVTGRTLVAKETLSAVNREIKDIEDVQGEAKTTSVMQEGIVFKQENISPKAAGARETDGKQSQMIATSEDAIEVGSVHDRNREVNVEVEVDSDDSDDTPRRGRKPKIDDMLVATVKKMCPEFPESWDFYASTKDKTESIKEFSEKPDIIRAIFLAETDTFKRVIRQSYPEALS